MRRTILALLLAWSWLWQGVWAVDAYTSLYVFGDGVSATTTAPSQPYFYGNRYSNGRVWVEVLAQRQGLSYGASNTVSFFGHFSSNLVINVTNFVAPADVGSSLFVVWVNNADFIDIIQRHSNPFVPTNTALWSSGSNQALSNHVVAIQALYNKGVRTLVMPNGVDVAKIPYYEFISPSNKVFIRQRIVEFNTSFANILQQSRNALSGLTIISPDFFGLSDKIIAQPGTYGFTNSTESAVFTLPNYSFTGAGTNFVFWDQYHPAAKVHEILADSAQQLIAPVRISGVAKSGTSNQLSVVNVPIGLNGFVEGSSNLLSWTSMQSFTSTNAAQSTLVPVQGPQMFYRLRFPFTWTWP